MILKLFALVAVFCGCLFIAGFIAGVTKDRMRLRILEDKNRTVVVAVTIPDVDDTYRWLQVYGCSVDVTENGAACTEGWTTASGREPHGLTQHLIPFRQVPGGPLQFTAFALDGQSKVVANGQITVLRGW